MPFTKTLDHTIINNNAYVMYQTVIDISKASKYIKILFKAFFSFWLARGGGGLWGVLGSMNHKYVLAFSIPEAKLEASE